MRGISLTSLAVLYGALLATFGLYSLAFPAPWFFDDRVNLIGLANVRDFQSAWTFVQSGVASSIGRPISNLSFLLNIGDLPGNPGGFRLTATLIHLINGLLLAWIAIRVARLLPILQARAEIFGSLLAATWLLHPLLFSATLMPVQRMTVLAGTFTLLGVLVYVIGRERLGGSSWRSGLLLCSVGAGLFSVLGVLTKENGALLPFFLCALELSVFRSVRVLVPKVVWRGWLVLFFVLPAILLILYFINGLPRIISGYEARSFNLDERLGAQSVILWEYLRQIFVPNVATLGPFQDDWTGQSLRSYGGVLAAGAWIGVLALLVHYRETAWPVTFALGWFLAGHLLESTIWPLELYFEHRNYIPSIGPLAALVGLAVASVSFRWVPWTLVALFAVVLWRITSAWSDPLLAAEMQGMYRPESTRATLFLASEYERRGELDVSARVLEAGSKRLPYQSAFPVVALQAACVLEDSRLVSTASEHIIMHSENFLHSHAVSPALLRVMQLVLEDRCPVIAVEKLLEVTDRLLDGERIRAVRATMHDIHYVRANLFMRLDRSDQAVKEIMSAFQYRRDAETAIVITTWLYSRGRYFEARELIDSAIEMFPAHRWLAQMRRLREQICQESEAGC